MNGMKKDIIGKLPTAPVIVEPVRVADVRLVIRAMTHPGRHWGAAKSAGVSPAVVKGRAREYSEALDDFMFSRPTTAGWARLAKATRRLDAICRKLELQEAK